MITIILTVQKYCRKLTTIKNALFCSTLVYSCGRIHAHKEIEHTGTYQTVTRTEEWEQHDKTVSQILTDMIDEWQIHGGHGIGQSVLAPIGARKLPPRPHIFWWETEAVPALQRQIRGAGF